MFCHNCGYETETNNCPKCGTIIIKPETKIIKSWRKEKDLKNVIKHPDVIELVYKYSKLSNEKISSQYILDKLDLVFGTFTGMSSNFIMELVVPVYSKLGIKTRKKDEFTFDLSINEVFVKLLCSISANKKLEFIEIKQGKDGLLIVSKIKPDLQSHKGDLIVTLKEINNNVIAELNTVIKGQVYDFGKSKKIISKTLADLKSIELD